MECMKRKLCLWQCAGTAAKQPLITSIQALPPPSPIPGCSHRHQVELLNNLAVLHHLFGKHQTAALYLARAMAAAASTPAATLAPVPAATAADDAAPTEGAPVLPLGGGGGGLAAEQRQGLWYNAGLQHLMLQDCAAALNCFEAAAGRWVSLVP